MRTQTVRSGKPSCDGGVPRANDSVNTHVGLLSGLEGNLGNGSMLFERRRFLFFVFSARRGTASSFECWISVMREK